MNISPPQVTDLKIVTKLIEILEPKITGMTFEEGSKVDKKAFEDKILKAAEFMKMVKLENKSVKLTSSGREYFGAEEKSSIIQNLIKQIEIYDTTIRHFYHKNNSEPTRTVIASYWHDNYKSTFPELASENELNAATGFFFKVLEKASLGMFILGRKGKVSRFKFDDLHLAEYITSATDLSSQEASEIEERESLADKKTDLVVKTEQKGQERSISNLLAIVDLERKLTESELDSPGARKLILNMLDESEKERKVLKANVDVLRKVEQDNAVLSERIKALSNLNLLRTSVNSIGGIIIGLAFLADTDLLTYLLGSAGIALVGISVYLREKPPKIDDA